jgi:hypothetical protein
VLDSLGRAPGKSFGSRERFDQKLNRRDSFLVAFLNKIRRHR